MVQLNPIDLSYRLEPTTPVYPNYPPLALEILEFSRCTIADARRAVNSSKITMGLHCGTHMDAPFHFFENGVTVDQVPLDVCVGEALMIDVRDKLAEGRIDVKHLKPYEAKMRDVRRIVLHTGWYGMWGKPEFFTSHPVFTPEAGQFILECGVRLVGVDFPSVDLPPFPVHLILLGNGIVIVENLTNLSAIKREVFEFVTLPLKLTGRDGSPVRAIALEES